MKNFIVITSIQQPTPAVKKCAEFSNARLVFVGDRKGPANINLPSVDFLNIDQQIQMDFKSIKTCPENHYVRKNIGYLYAISRGAEIIAETDDDNFPDDNWLDSPVWGTHEFTTLGGPRFINAFERYCEPEDKFWPRGFPLEKIISNDTVAESTNALKVGVWQFLADHEPDVDAIYRLVIGKTIHFKKGSPVVLKKGSYCPFNSQNTFWSKETFPLLYLPVTVTFRECDIVRSYVTQRLLWEQDLYVGFGAPTVYQDRNPHNLIEDFKLEKLIYEHTSDLVNVLENLSLGKNMSENMRLAYEALIKQGLVKPAELIALDAWLDDLAVLQNADATIS